jgi:hypothetical protein
MQTRLNIQEIAAPVATAPAAAAPAEVEEVPVEVYFCHFRSDVTEYQPLLSGEAKRKDYLQCKVRVTRRNREAKNHPRSEGVDSQFDFDRGIPDLFSHIQILKPAYLLGEKVCRICS